jgi:hypothetical protein
MSPDESTRKRVVPHGLSSTVVSPAPCDPSEEPTRPSERHTHSPEQLGEFPKVPGHRLIRVVGQGGMGIVYEAEDCSLTRPVAVKVMLPGQDVERFVFEAQITARLPHPGIPPVHSQGVLADGRPFLAMKLIRGDTLADSLKTKIRDELIVILERICETVGFAHSRGIVHRDLKPANVMVGAFGEVQVMDWGLVKSFDDESKLDSTAVQPRLPHHIEQTVAGSIKGTPAYMAPEQARGEPVDARADVFALGGILAVILTGRPPFVGNTILETVLLAAGGEVEPCYEALDSCGADPELIALAKRCLSRLATDRPPNAVAVADEIAAHRRRFEERLRTSERERAVAVMENVERRKRRRLTTALAAATIALAAGAVAFAWWQDHVESRRKAEVAQSELERERRAAGQREEARSSLDRCVRALAAGDAKEAAAALEAARKPVEDAVLEDLSAQVMRCRQALELLRELDSIDRARWGQSSRHRPDGMELAAKWRVIFAARSVSFSATDSAGGARYVLDSLIRDRLLGVLDLWHTLDPDPGLAAVLKAADPDELRDNIRATLLELAKDRHDIEAIRRILESVSRSAWQQQPARFTLPLAILAPTKEKKREILGRMLITDPGNFGGLIEMAESWVNEEQGKGPGERLRWCQAAAAAHPENPTALYALGDALFVTGDYEGAVVSLERLVVLDPDSALNWNLLGMARRAVGSSLAGLTALKVAAKLAPAEPGIHVNLGHAFESTKEYGAAVESYRTALTLLKPGDEVFAVTIRSELRSAQEKLEEERRKPAKVEPVMGFRVAGKVTIRGLPPREGEVRFARDDRPTATSASTTIQPDGTFVTRLTKGRYKVAITAKGVPEKYSDFGTTDVIVDVKDEANLDLKLDSSAGAVPPNPKGNSPTAGEIVPLDTLRTKYVAAVRSFGTFALRFREDYVRQGTPRLQPPKSRPKELRTEVEWVHGSKAMLYRWKTTTPGGGDGFLRTDGKTLWTHGNRAVHEPSLPVVTTEPVKEFEPWNAIDDNQSTPFERGVLSTKEPTAFLECLGTRIQLAPDDGGINPTPSLASLFRGRCQLLGKADLQGASCWHVGFRPYVDRDRSPLPRDLRWHVEAWFDPAANHLPRKMIVRKVRHVMQEGEPQVERIEYEVHSFTQVGEGNAKTLFPAKWVRIDYPASQTPSPPFSETTFTLLDGTIVGSDVTSDHFEPPLPPGLPVIQKSEYSEWVRKNAPVKK